MNYFNVLLDLVGQLDSVGFLLLSAEDDGLATTVAGQDVAEGGLAILVRAVDGEMLDRLGGFLG